MNRSMVGRTVVGGALGALLFGGVSLFQAMRSDAEFPGVLQPIGVFTLIGLTIGALTGPLIGQAIARARGRDR
jgi:H+/Cl- antiporter ClcA